MENCWRDDVKKVIINSLRYLHRSVATVEETLLPHIYVLFWNYVCKSVSPFKGVVPKQQCKLAKTAIEVSLNRKTSRIKV